MNTVVRTEMNRHEPTAMKRRMSQSTAAPEKRLKEDKPKPIMISSERIVRASQSKYRPCKVPFYSLALVQTKLTVKDFSNGDEPTDSRASPVGDPNLQAHLEYPGDSERYGCQYLLMEKRKKED